MSNEKQVTQRDIDEANVKLKPIFGIEPGKYLLALYILIIAIILFCIFFMPGISNPGQKFSFIADPEDSAVLVDGVYKASTPCDLFIPAGKHNITITRPGFNNWTQEVFSKKQIFASNMRKKEPIIVKLQTNEGFSILQEAVNEFADWTLTGKPNETYQIPMVLSEAASAWLLSEDKKDEDLFIKKAFSLSSDSTHIRDTIRAASISFGKSCTITACSLGSIVKTASKLIKESPECLYIISNYLDQKEKTKLVGSTYYKDYLARLQSRIEAIQKPNFDSKLEKHGNVNFVALPSGEVCIKSSSAPFVSYVDSFLLSQNECTKSEYQAFITAVPEWSIENKQSLIKKGLVSENYLDKFESLLPDEPIRYISKYAAEAYCKWFTEQTALFTCRLPSEAEWLYAANLGGQSTVNSAVLHNFGKVMPVSELIADDIGFTGMLGNVWEWNQDDWSVQPALNVNNNSSIEESLVKGGSWANLSDLVDIDSRGVVQNSDCSDYLGFRIVLVPVTEK